MGEEHKKRSSKLVGRHGTAGNDTATKPKANGSVAMETTQLSGQRRLPKTVP